MRGLIIGATKKSAEQRINRLIQDYEDRWNIKPELFRESSTYEFAVLFKNGDLWRVLDGSGNIEKYRGIKGHILLVDNNLPDKIKTWCTSMLRWTFPYGAIQYY